MVIQLLKGIPKLAIKGWKKGKGTPQRKIKAKALREHRASEFYKRHKKIMKKIPHDLTYMKGYLKGK